MRTNSLIAKMQFIEKANNEDFHDMITVLAMKKISLFRGLPNYWMVKSPDSSGDGDAIITSNLSCILRLPDTGPKVRTSSIFQQQNKSTVLRLN